MPTPFEIDQQVQLEREQISLGIKRLHDNTRKLEEKSYASASIYGITSVDVLLPLVVEKVDETYCKIEQRKNGVAFAEIRKHLKDVEPLALAAIATRLTFDKVFSYRDKQNYVTTIADSIGTAIENECLMRHYEKVCPGLLHSLKENYWHKSIGTHQKLTVIKTLINRSDVEKFETWGRDNRIKLGTWLLDCVMGVSNWFMKDMRQEGRKRAVYIIPTPEFLEIKDQVMKDSELFAPLSWPMLIEPNDWSPQKDGGYILNEVMKGNPMVRRGNPACIQGEIPFQFLNRIQKVEYQLNPFIVEVAKTLEEKGMKVGKFIPISEIPLPPKPPNIATDKEVRMGYRRNCAEVHNLNAQVFRLSCRTRMTMEAVRRFEDKKFYIPWSFDYRGRVYPIPAFLTPQDTDFGKSLIRFHQESMMTPEAEQWLAFQVATTYGLDKSTLEERQVWVKENITLITDVALDPIGNLSLWDSVDEPWQFLAACEEYTHCVISKKRKSTGLPVAVDATASGLQILAGLSRDKSTAILTNVYPSDRPQDAYKAVSEMAKPHCPEHLQPYIDRKVSKRLVMTIPYSAKYQSNWKYVKLALEEKGLEPSKEDVTAVTNAMRDAVFEIFPGPMKVMKWIEKEVPKILQKKDHLQWTTPSGFIVYQKIQKYNKVRLTLQLLGRIDMVVQTDENDQIDRSRHRNATSPNLIHSQDASLLHLATNQFNEPIALIHDSVLCRATDMSKLSCLVRETYMYLFAEHDYLTDFAQQIGAETEPPIIGDLEPSDVIESTYFFC